jgi:Na+/proline symporter
MIPVEIVSIVALLYVGLLFAVAHFAEKRREAGRSVIANPYVYALALAVHYNAWAYYGLVGQAATSGIAFLAAYLGPTLMAFSWWFLLRKMVRVAKEQNILSIADFISSRYGKSPLLGAVVTVFSIVAIMPNLALQLKAVAYTFDLLATSAAASGGLRSLFPALPPSVDTSFLVTLFLALFGILFGARRLDVSERHEGLMAAIALQSVVKLVAFLAVGIFVTYGLFDGVTDILTRFNAQFPDRAHLFLLGTQQVPYTLWFTWLFFSMMAVMFLPRQFHVLVIENSSEEHIKNAMWHYPAYTFLLSLFVMPVALGGLILNGGETAAADYFALHLPLQTGHPWLAMLVFIGGFSASAGMVMLESVVLSTMILNHLVIPVILKLRIEAADMSRALINIKRLGIVGVVFLGHVYYQLIGEPYTLINIGVVSLIAATQFAPAVIGGLYWKRATRRGALTGLVLGGILWFYTLVLPLVVRSSWFYDQLLPLLVRTGWLERDILTDGPFGLGFLRPQELFGLGGLDMVTHSLFWTLFFNLGAFIALSLLTEPDRGEAEQGVKFVDVFGAHEEPPQRKRLSNAPAVVEFVGLMTKFIGEKQAHAAIAHYLADKEIDERGSLSEYELPVLKRFTERVLAGSVGAAAAGVIVDSYLAARGSELEDVFDIFGTVTLGRTASREQMGVLCESARVVASGADLQTILDAILELLRQQFKFDLCIIRILDEARMVLTVQSQKGMHWDPSESEREPNMETYAGAAFMTNTVVVVNDTDQMDKPISIRAAHLRRLKSFAHAPIAIEGRPIGVLSVFSETVKGVFTDDFVELFKSLADQIGVAWRNARQTERLIAAREQERELQIARAIQLGLLPSRVPDVAGISLAGRCVPAREVGGDYFDFLLCDDHALDLVIADVSGHNVGAALIMASVRTFIQATARNIREPQAVLAALNDFLHDDLTRAELFITMFYVEFDPSAQQLSFASAGHNPPLVWKAATRSCEWLDAEGLILGVRKGVVFEERQTRLQPGDILILYTDGITEAADRDGQCFGEARLCALLHDLYPRAPHEIVDAVLAGVQMFTGAQSFVDDVSIVVMKVEEPLRP